MVVLAAETREQTIHEILETTGARVQWDAARGIGVLRNADTYVSFRPGSRWGLVNYANQRELGEIRRIDGNIIFSAEAAETVLSILKPVRQTSSDRYISTIFIDAGHGGRDPGAVGIHTINGERWEIKEKDIVLDVSMRLRDMLRRGLPERDIMMSRDDDTYLRLEERTEAANSVELGENETIIFLSIHANATFNTRAQGFEVWVLPPEERRVGLVDSRTTGVSDPGVLSILNTIREEELTIESVLLSRSLLKGLAGSVGEVAPNRGMKTASWSVVRNARMPSVLVELGFVTNKEEALRMADADHLHNLALGLYNGIVEFIRYFEAPQ